MFQINNQNHQKHCLFFVGCGTTFLTASQGSITSPNYPSSYLSNTDCYYTISLIGSTSISFAFSGAYSMESCCDWVKVGNSLLQANRDFEETVVETNPVYVKPLDCNPKSISWKPANRDLTTKRFDILSRHFSSLLALISLPKKTESNFIHIHFFQPRHSWLNSCVFSIPPYPAVSTLGSRRTAHDSILSE